MSREIFGRMTPQGENHYVLLELQEHFNKIFEKYVLSQEVSSKGVIHYHFYAVIADSLSNQTIKSKIKGKKQEQFKVEVYISGKDVRDKLKSIGYTIKDGNYVQKGIDYNTMNKAKEVSYKKINFQQEINRIKDEYSQNLINHRQVVKEVLNTYKVCKNSFHMQHAIATVNYIMLCHSDSFKMMEDKIVEFTRLKSRYGTNEEEVEEDVYDD